MVLRPELLFVLRSLGLVLLGKCQVGFGVGVIRPDGVELGRVLVPGVEVKVPLGKDVGRSEVIFVEQREFGVLFMVVRLVPAVELAFLLELLADLGVPLDLALDLLLLFEKLIILGLEKLDQVVVLAALYPVDELRFQQGLLDWIDPHHIQQVESVLFDLDSHWGQIGWDLGLHAFIQFSLDLLEVDLSVPLRRRSMAGLLPKEFLALLRDHRHLDDVVILGVQKEIGHLK